MFGKRHFMLISFRYSPAARGKSAARSAIAQPEEQQRQRGGNVTNPLRCLYESTHKCITSHFPPSPRKAGKTVMHSACSKSRCVDDPSIRIDRECRQSLSRLPASLFHYALIVAQHFLKCKNYLPDTKNFYIFLSILTREFVFRPSDRAQMMVLHCFGRTFA